MNCEKFVDGQIALLQSDIVDFEYLNYLEANQGFSLEELVNVFRYAYPESEQEEGTDVEDALLMETIERAQDVMSSENKEVETTKQVAPEVPMEVGAGQERQGREAREEVVPCDEDPGNAGKI